MLPLRRANTALGKEFFRTCNVLPFSCTHLALWVKDPRYMQKKRDSRISLALGTKVPNPVVTSFWIINVAVTHGIISFFQFALSYQEMLF